MKDMVLNHINELGKEISILCQELDNIENTHLPTYREIQKKIQEKQLELEALSKLYL